MTDMAQPISQWTTQPAQEVITQLALERRVSRDICPLPLLKTTEVTEAETGPVLELPWSAIATTFPSRCLSA